MKNLKRILSIVVATAMLLACNVSFVSADYSDVADSHKYAEAVNLLSGLGILTGYEDGSFKPEGTITRAEAATVMVRVLGMEDEVAKSDTIFPDVTRSHWASGYVNVAVANGIINGFPDGTFRPEENLTYDQIVKMIVCAIGHELKATELGGYPQGYIRAASDAKVTKGLTGSAGQEASRGLVAQLIYNALEVEMMDATSFSTGILGTSYSYNGKTLLRDFLEIEKVDAIVKDTYLTGETFDSRNKYITLDITSVYGFDDRASRYLYEKGDIVEFEESEYSDANVYLGYAVTAYVGEDSDGVDTIFAITEDSGRNTTVEVVKERFFADKSDEEVISYAKRSTDRYLTELELDKDVQVVVNGEFVSNAVTYYFDTFDIMTLVDNNRDSEYDFVFISEFDESEGVEFVVTEIEEDDDYYYFEGDDGELELDYEDDDVLITIIRDGKVVEPDDIEVGDTVTCLNAARRILTVYVSSETVRGTIDEVDQVEGEYYIGNKAYTLSPAFAESLSAGDEGTFYLNYQGKIAYSTVTKTITAGDYVFVTGYETETRFNNTTYLVQAVTEEGEIETYTLKSKKMKYVNSSGIMFRSVEASTVYNYMTTNLTDLSHEYNVPGYVGLAKVKASSAGVISEIYFPGSYEEFFEQTRYASTNTKEYSERRETYGSYDLSKEPVVFRIDDKEDVLTDAVEVGEIWEFFTDGGNYTFLAYGERGEALDVLVVTDGIATANYEEHALIITRISQVVANGEPTEKITGIQDGKTVIYTIDPDESFDVEVGNIVIVGANGEGFISKLEKVANTTYDYTDLYYVLDDVDIPSDDEAGVFAGMVADKTSKRFEIDGIEDAFYNDSNVAYTLIDYTGRETTVAKGSFSDIKVTSSTDTFVVVRTYEDEAVDVFIFRLDTKFGMDIPAVDIWDTVKPVEPETEASTSESATEAPAEDDTDEPETVAPTESDTDEPVSEPTTAAPTEGDTDEPVSEPTTAPAESDTDEPASESTTAPAESDTDEPASESTTAAPTESDTDEPASESTTAAPTEGDTDEPASEPTTAAPTESDTDEPASEPTTAPAESDTDEPASEPTTAPAESDTDEPVSEPTTAPANEPTSEPATDGPVLAGVTTPVTENKVTLSEKLAKEVLALINAERVKAGLKAFELDAAVTKVSEAHGVDMATNNYLNQVARDGSTIQARLTKANVIFTLAAENLAKGNYTSQIIVDAWMKSETHKANILSTEFTKIGIGVAVAVDGTHYWVLDFIK